MPEPSPQPAGITAPLLGFLHRLAYEDLPAEVVRQAKRCLLEYLGVTLAGATAETAAKVRAFLAALPDAGGVTAIGHGCKTDLLKAALANGITSHILELDDGERRSYVHPSAAVLSALLPLAEHERLDGRRVVVGIVAGYEAAIRLGRAIQPSHRARGFHVTGTCGTFGAAAAAAAALRLPAKAWSDAWGLAGTSASGWLQFLSDGSEMKQFHPGKAAMCGLLAAYLAKSGLSAPADILEGEKGFLQGCCDAYDVEACIGGLGERWAIMDVYRKPYAACRHCHGPIEAVLRMRSQAHLRAKEVREIRVLTYRSAVDGHSDPRPSSSTGAKMSVPFSVAVALHTGWAGENEFSVARYSDPTVLALADRVRMHEDPELTRLVPAMRPAIVEIATHDGRLYRERVDAPRGEPENPLSDEEVVLKFESLASASRSPEEVSAIREIVENAEERLAELYTLLG